MSKQLKMYVIGGAGPGQQVPEAPAWKNGECDKYAMWSIFDINTGKWQDTQDPITDKVVKYKVPKALTEVIGGE
jgi:hypothetical protein